MNDTHPHRVLIVTDTADPNPELLEAIKQRTAQSPAQFRVVIPNPARAEVHLLHPERHDKAAAAEQVLRAALPELERAAGGHVVGSVSVQHDPMDTLEHVLNAEPIDEIMLAVHEHALTVRLHQDLQHRLGHLGVPVTVVGHGASAGAS
ncbi:MULTISPECIES: hypothetical protein [unclassified Nocardioides]|uniref:hypothetical protein n=1 Tax=unclassified Nocardioides TaxID=2615069 RepID=UPI0002F0E977|nr:MULTISPECIES: hypothetical protein [unclassified Nocardioides]